MRKKSTKTNVSKNIDFISKRMSQKDLARIIGVKPSVITNLKKGDTKKSKYAAPIEELAKNLRYTRTKKTRTKEQQEEFVSKLEKSEVAVKVVSKKPPKIRQSNEKVNKAGQTMKTVTYDYSGRHKMSVGEIESFLQNEIMPDIVKKFGRKWDAVSFHIVAEKGSGDLTTVAHTNFFKLSSDGLAYLISAGGMKFSGSDPAQEFNLKYIKVFLVR